MSTQPTPEDLEAQAPQQEVQESVRTSGRNCYLCGHPEEAHPMEPNPRGGMRRGSCPLTAVWSAPSGEAEPQWLPLTPEILTAIESGDHGARFWVVSKWLSEPVIGEYEWRQGRRPHGFNTQDSRFGADEVTHVLPYKAPPMPAARKEGNNP